MWDVRLVRHHKASTLPINCKVTHQITSRSVSYWRMWAHNPQLHCLFFVHEGLPEVPHQKVVPKDVTLYTALIQLCYHNTVHLPFQQSNEENYRYSAVTHSTEWSVLKYVKYIKIYKTFWAINNFMGPSFGKDFQRLNLVRCMKWSTCISHITLNQIMLCLNINTFV